MEILSGRVTAVRRLTRNVWFAFLVLLVVAFTVYYIRRSGDYTNYYYFFSVINGEKDFSANRFVYDYELGFKWWSYLLSVIGGRNAHNLTVFATVVPIIFYSILFKRKSVFPLVSLAIYVAHYHWWIGVTLLRQMYAVCFLLVALCYLARSRWKSYFVYAVVASLFHTSAIIFLLVPLWVRYVPSFKWQNILIVASYLLGKVGIAGFFATLLPFIDRGSEYQRYLDNGRMGLNILSYLEMYVVFLLLHWRARQVDDPEYRSGLAVSSMSLLVCGVFVNFELASRLAMYFNFWVYLFVFPLMLRSLRMRGRVCAMLIALLYLFLYLYRFIMVNATV